MNFRKSVKTFENHINKYFNNCYQDERQPTINGLALHLDLTYKQIKDYPINSEFYPSIQKAIARIAVMVEEILLSKNNLSGNLHWLKVQQDWVAVEKQSLDHQSSDGSMSPVSPTFEDFYTDIAKDNKNET